MKRKSEGFTLVELMVVLSVIATLAAIAVTGYTSLLKSGRDSRRRTNTSQYKNALEQFYAQNSRYPFTSAPDNGLDALVPGMMSNQLLDPLPASVTPTLTYVADTNSGSDSYILYTNLEMGGYWVVCSAAVGGGKVGKLDNVPGGGWTTTCPL